MTLNITVAARWLMVQSSDFRLTRADADDPISETAQKQVVLRYRNWSGLICYTGVASHGSHDTATWLGEVLTHEFGERSPEQVIKQIADSGSQWLRQVPLKNRNHTFTMITYESGIPHIYLLSNYQLLGRDDLLRPASTLKLSHARVRQPKCVVTGSSRTVTRHQREHLEQLLASNLSPETLREDVAVTSREAASRSENRVGESCIVSHLMPDGSGEAQVFGNLQAEFLPAMISHGVNMATVFTPKLKSQIPGSSRLVAATWTTGGGQIAAMLGAYRDLSKQIGSGWPNERDKP